MLYFSDDTCALTDRELDASFLYNKAPIKNDPICIVPNQAMFINDSIDNKEYRVMKGFSYLWKGLPIVIIKHLIIDPIQDVLIKLGLDNSIKGISNKFASFFGYEPIEPNLEPGMAHQFMHKIFAPVLKLFGLDTGCNHNHVVDIAPVVVSSIASMVQNTMDEDSEISSFDEDAPMPPILCGKMPILIPTKCESGCALPHHKPKFTQLTDGGYDDSHVSFGPQLTSELTPQNIHVHQPKTFMSDFKEEYVMHASVKAIAVGVFPFIYSIKSANICNGYESFCSYGASSIKAVGINPLELIYGLHSIAAQITPKAYSDIVGNAEFYLSYQHLKGDKEAYEYLQAQDLFLEGVDGFIHAIDNIELLYTNRNIPGIKIVAAGMAIAGGMLYYNTKMHENEFAGEAPQDLEYNS